MNGVQTRLKCKPNVKRCKRFVFAAHSPLLHPNTLKTKAIIHFQTDHILTRFVFPPLNSYTQLHYNANYGATQRVVSLIGEAYFEVAKDKEKPFIVETAGMNVEALGTTFNVKAYREDSQIIATLFSGSVRVSSDRDNVILSPDENATFERRSGKLAIHKPDNSSYAKMWRNNDLVFNGETLEEIAVLLNRMYNVQIAFKSERIKQYCFSGVICNNSLDNVIELISLTSPITYETRGDTIILGNR